MDQQHQAEEMSSSSSPPQLPPGFRFHPTDEELILHYLRNRAASSPCPVPIIADVDIYKFDPWDLPAQAAYGDGEYYFFSPRDRKYPNGIRPNRAAGSGYWKATGTDKPIHHDPATGGESVVGVKKALVFYRGRPPRGAKTNWIMHEYRLATAGSSPLAAAGYRTPPSKFRNNNVSISMRLDDWVLCRIYKKSGQASPLVPPLADYDHLDHDEPSSGGPFDDVFYGGLYAPPPTTTTTCTSSAGASATTTTATASSALVVMPPPPHHHQQQQPRLPKIPSLSELFDEYALAQIFDTAVPPVPPADPLAVHPSLNHLLAVGTDDAGGNKRKQAVLLSPPDECLHPPAKRLSVGSLCFDAPHAQPATGLPAAVLLNHHHNNHMLPQF